jgi:hypothetical protein
VKFGQSNNENVLMTRVRQANNAWAGFMACLGSVTDEEIEDLDQ